MNYPPGTSVVHIRADGSCRRCKKPIKKGWIALAHVIKPGDNPANWRHEHECKSCAMALYQ